jgi:aspartyl protease
VTRNSRIQCTYSHITYILDAYKRYVKETGAVFDNTTGLLRIDSDRYKKLKSLHFNIGGHTYELNRNAQIWPRALNTLIGGDKDLVYLVVNDLGPDLSKDIGFIAGMTFLERFYVVFDSGSYRVGLAKTQFTNSTNIN